MSRTTLEKFYAAFARLDGDAMQACYADDASFDDEAFSLAGRAQIGGMWRMLTETTKAKARDAWKLEVSDITDSSAHWEAHYRFTATGRKVHNIIEAEFQFQSGRILVHRDSFSFWRWSSQALGPSGLLLGWSPFLHNKVRATARARLDKFIQAHPEYQ